MRRPLLWVTLLGAIAAATAAALIVRRAFPPPDASAAAAGVAWLGGPYLLAAGLALVFRRRPTVLWALLIAVALAGTVGASLYDGVADGAIEARRQAETAVLPGEDPDHGPGGMRKAGADFGAFVAEAFGVAVLVVVPPVQAVAVALAAGIGYALSAWRRGRAEARRVWEAEHTDDRGEYHPPG
jgi:hypothetical protein